MAASHCRCGTFANTCLLHRSLEAEPASEDQSKLGAQSPFDSWAQAVTLEILCRLRKAWQPGSLYLERGVESAQITFTCERIVQISMQMYFSFLIHVHS